MPRTTIGTGILRGGPDAFPDAARRDAHAASATSVRAGLDAEASQAVTPSRPARGALVVRTDDFRSLNALGPAPRPAMRPCWPSPSACEVSRACPTSGARRRRVAVLMPATRAAPRLAGQPRSDPAGGAASSSPATPPRAGPRSPLPRPGARHRGARDRARGARTGEQFVPRIVAALLGASGEIEGRARRAVTNRRRDARPRPAQASGRGMGVMREHPVIGSGSCRSRAWARRRSRHQHGRATISAAASSWPGRYHGLRPALPCAKTRDRPAARGRRSRAPIAPVAAAPASRRGPTTRGFR